ncbi:MAG: Clp protease N-terminal domain-containing protein, partial [Bryobacteraceae bacterium]
MDFNRFTEKTQQALQGAQSKATRYSHQQVDVEHLLTALLEQEGGLALSLLLKAEVQAEGLHRRLEQELSRMPKVTTAAGAPDQIYVT